MRAADAARSAFAIGWAKTTATNPVPLTERARIACLACMHVAEASPAVDLGPTLKLGQLEGIWAVIYARREALEKLHGQALTAVLDAISKLDWQPVIDQIERQLLLDPNMSPTVMAAKLDSAAEQLINGALPSADRAAWRTAMNAALIDARAEGQTVALSLVGDAAGVTINWDLAATAAKAALAGNQELWDSATGWIADQTHGLGYQVGQKLASLWTTGASRSDMEDAITDLLGATTNNAGHILDYAISQSLSWGSLSTYSDAAVQYVEFITAGDGRVCAACDEAEDDSPYLLSDAPLPGLHVSCRCCLAPSDYIPTGAALQLVDQYADDAAEAGGEDMAA